MMATVDLDKCKTTFERKTELQGRKIYTELSECKKCGSFTHKVRHIDNNQITFGGCKTKIIPYMEVTCSHCGFWWAEAPRDIHEYIPGE